ncbi:MAG: UDP-N-acetylglucosamine--N-acetylmuramyl-(pentapeptide) pyrophosphoryl-undecaprenol N-acetylglucosamine transferase [Pirellulales bacterium]
MNILPFQSKRSRSRQAKDYRQLHVAFSGGATCGHLFPGVAVAEALLRRRPNTRITFVGNGRTRERNIIEGFGWQYIELASQPAPTNPAAAWRFVADHVASSRKASRLLDEQGVNAVVGLGGYASVPTARAAIARRIPLVLLEQNAVPGMATRWLASRADHICLAFAGAQAHLSTEAAISVSGNPVRRVFYSDLGSTVGDDAKRSGRQLLILGGSGGAGQLNEQIPRALYKVRHLLAGWNVVHQAGNHGAVATRSLYRKFQIDAAVEPFIEDVAPLVRAADLVICRAGGTTLAELAAAGAPAIMIPWSGAKDNHQRRNAETFARHESAAMIDPREVEGRLDNAIAATLSELLPDRQRRLAMGVAISRHARPKAAQYVASTITELVHAATRLAA